jgi:hypothetical protein
LTATTHNLQHSSSSGSGYVSPLSDQDYIPNNYNAVSPSTVYEEDYGPEFSHSHSNSGTYLLPNPAFSQPPKESPSSQDRDGYIDLEDGLYGGNTSLSRYPEPSAKRRGSGSKTEWPLRNFSVGGGNGHKRNRSPMWDRVYEN